MQISQRKILFLCLMFLVTSLVSSGLLAQETARWTFMLYAVADNDLEPYIYGDLLEMQAVASTDQINIVAQVDRAEGFDDGYGDWTEARRFHLSPGMNELQLVQNIGEVNGGDPASLVDFVTWTITNYPAEHYALVIWSHGGGWLGIGPDYSSQPGMLSLPEITEALREIQEQTGIAKLDIVGFDACLMSQLEVLAAVAPFAQYSIAAEETIPGNSWEYTTPLTALVQNPDMNPTELGQSIIDSYMTYYTEVATGYPQVDLHMIDLSKLGRVLSLLGNFSQMAQANAEAVFTAIGQARNSAQMFASSTPDQAAYYSSVDLMDFMALFSGQEMEPELVAAAQQVYQAASDSVVYSRASAALPNAHGISIYFPFNAEYFNLADNATDYPQTIAGEMQAWNAFLKNFHSTTEALLDPTTLTIDIYNVVRNNETNSIYDPPIIQFRSDGKGVIGLEFIATYVAEDGSKVILEKTPLVSQTINEAGNYVMQDMSGEQDLDFQWRAEIPFISDGNVSLPALLLLPSAQAAQATVSGLYYNQAGESVLGYLEFNRNTELVTAVWGIADAGDGTEVPFEIRPQSGDTFAPTLRFLDENGEIVLYEMDARLTFGEEPFTYEYRPAPSGEYELTMILTDMAGNIATSTSSTTIDNESLDPAYRGFKEIYNGFGFLYPAAWPEPDTLFDEEGSVSYLFQDGTGSANIYVTLFYVESVDEILQIAQTNLEDLELLDYTAGEAEAYDGETYNGYLFSYEFTTAEGEARTGAVLAAYAPETGLGVILDMDTNADGAEEATQALGMMLGTLNFFEPLAAVPES